MNRFLPTAAVRKNKDDIARALIRKMKPLESLSDELTRHLRTLDEERTQFNARLNRQRLSYEQLKYRAAEYFHKGRLQRWEKDVIDPISKGAYEAPTDQEIELELLKRKDTLGLATYPGLAGNNKLQAPNNK